MTDEEMKTAADVIDKIQKFFGDFTKFLNDEAALIKECAEIAQEDITNDLYDLGWRRGYHIGKADAVSRTAKKLQEFMLKLKGEITPC